MVTKKPEISVLIVNYKQEKDLKSLLKGIPSFLKGLTYEILVFDNSSELDKSNQYKLFSLNKNIGYGSAINYLSLKARGEYLLILNADVSFKGTLKPYFKNFKDNQDFSKGILSLGKPDVLYFLPLLSSFRVAKRFSSYAFLIPTNLFRGVGGFDWNYFMYFEDDDLAYKLKKLNIHSLFLDSPLVVHKKTYTNTSFKMRKKYYYKSLLYFLGKNKKPWGYLFAPLIYLKIKI